MPIQRPSHVCFRVFFFPFHVHVHERKKCFHFLFTVKGSPMPRKHLNTVVSQVIYKVTDLSSTVSSPPPLPHVCEHAHMSAHMHLHTHTHITCFISTVYIRFFLCAKILQTSECLAMLFHLLGFLFLP